MSYELLKRLQTGPKAQEYRQKGAAEALMRFAKGKYASEDPIAGFEKWISELELFGTGVEQLKKEVLAIPKLAGIVAFCASHPLFLVDRYEKTDGPSAIGLKLEGEKHWQGGIEIVEGEREDRIKQIGAIAGFDIYNRVDKKDHSEPAMYAYLRIGDALIRIPHNEDSDASELVNEIKRHVFFDKTLLDEKVALTLELIRSVRAGIKDFDGKPKAGLVISEDVACALGFLYIRSPEDPYDGALETREIEVTTKIPKDPSPDDLCPFRFVYNKWRIVYDHEIEDTSPRNKILVIRNTRVGSVTYMDAYFGEGLYSSCFFNERRFLTEMLWI